MEWVWVGESVCGFFKRTCLQFQNFLPLTLSLLVFVARSCGDLSSWQCSPGLGACCGAITPCSWDIPAEFLSTIHGCGTSPFHICTPPTSLDRCGFFKSVVVRLLFNSIFDGCEWWLFYILVVILLQLYEEVSHVCLCYHPECKIQRLFNSLLLP